MGKRKKRGRGKSRTVYSRRPGIKQDTKKRKTRKKGGGPSNRSITLQRIKVKREERERIEREEREREEREEREREEREREEREERERIEREEREREEREREEREERERIERKEKERPERIFRRKKRLEDWQQMKQGKKDNSADRGVLPTMVERITKLINEAPIKAIDEPLSSPEPSRLRRFYYRDIPTSMPEVDRKLYSKKFSSSPFSIDQIDHFKLTLLQNKESNIDIIFRIGEAI